MTYMLGPCSVKGCPFHHDVTVTSRIHKPAVNALPPQGAVKPEPASPRPVTRVRVGGHSSGLASADPDSPAVSCPPPVADGG